MTDEQDLEVADLDPDKSPGELKEPATRSLPFVRRLNKYPLYIGVGVLVIAVCMFAYIITDRAQQQAAAQQVSDKPVEVEEGAIRSSSMSYNELVSGIPDGTIPAHIEQPVKPLEPVEVVKVEVPKTPEQPKADPLGVANKGAGFQPSNTPAGLDQRMAERINQTKMQKTAEAIYAGTRINFESGDLSESGKKLSSGRSGASSGSSQDKIDQYRERMMQIAKELNPGGAGRSAGGFGGLGGSGSSDSNKGFLNDGPSGSDWRLQAQREQGERHSVKTGTVIPAIMISGINSDLPGQVVAQVSQNVFDTATGFNLLIPQGTRLVGEYNNGVKMGQERVMLRWDRMIFPDGSTLDMAGMPGADQMGFAGFKDKVNNHYMRIFGSAFMLSLISAGYQLSLPDTNTTIGGSNSYSAKEEIAFAMASQFNEVGSEMIRRQMDIAPTIEIRPGYKFNVMINKDMIFDSSYSPLALR